MSQFRVDIYSEPHKELRKHLFEVSMRCGQTDFKNQCELTELSKHIVSLIAALKKHAWHEDTYAHPIIGTKLPQSREDLEREHEEQHRELAHLGARLTSITNSSTEEQKVEQGAQLYQALNRFIARYLMHLEQEEQSLLILWERCEASELFAIMIAFSANEQPEFLPMFLKISSDNLSHDEKVRMFSIISERLGQQIFTRAYTCAEPHMSARECEEIIKLRN